VARGLRQGAAKGASEAEIAEALNVIVAAMERERGRVDDLVIDEMILMVKECASAAHAPRKYNR
jgi:hypothetical protein